MQRSFGKRFDKVGVWALSFFALVLFLGTTAGSSAVAPRRPYAVSKRSFFSIQCRGAYDKDIFEKLNRVCDDCFNLFREPELHVLCTSNCFGSTYFKGCLDALLLSEEEEKYDQMIEALGKK